jgi:hypothetical protein
MDWKRMEVIDPVMMGKIIVDWALGRLPRPRDFAEFKEQVKGALIIKPYVTQFKLIDTDPDVVTIRLPPAEVLRQAEAAYGDQAATVDNYPFADYLHVDRAKIKAEQLTPLQLFYASVGDYTTKECE